MAGDSKRGGVKMKGLRRARASDGMRTAHLARRLPLPCGWRRSSLGVPPPPRTVGDTSSSHHPSSRQPNELQRLHHSSSTHHLPTWVGTSRPVPPVFSLFNIPSVLRARQQAAGRQGMAAASMARAAGRVGGLAAVGHCPSPSAPYPRFVLRPPAVGYGPSPTATQPQTLQPLHLKQPQQPPQQQQPVLR